MEKKSYILIPILISIFGVGIVFTMSLATSNKANHQHNSFLREFLANPILLTDRLDVQYNSYYIAGATSENIYFGNVTAPWRILIANTRLADTQHVKLNIEDQENLQFRTIKVTVDSPYFYFADGTVPAIFRGKLGDWRGSRYTYDRAPFMQSIPIGNTSNAISTTSSISNEFTLAKEMNSPPYIRLVPELLEKQIDGKFCVDGMFHYSKELGNLVYVYYYRNQFIVADTSLNLVYRGNTIDTVSRAKIKIAKIRSDKSITHSSPPLVVNKKSCVSGRWLFINSNLLAKNEDIEAFEKSSVIDVYNLEDGQYSFSFYLPQYEDNKMREFKVFGSMLIALYDHYVLKYKLDIVNL